MRICGFVFTILVGLLLIRCNSEKYFGYNYNAERLVKTAHVFGKVTNIFTGLPVVSAQISIDDQQTTTDLVGNYELTYVLSADAEQGKQIPIRIQATNYIPLFTTGQFFPESTQLDFRLEYGAPIIKNSVLVNVAGQPICQTIVMDYQGASDIASVVAQFNYLDSLNLVAHRIEMPLSVVKTPSLNVNYYQIAPPDSIDDNVLAGFYAVTATDKSGFTHTFEHLFNPFNPDTLLFDPFNP